ncbi:heat shock protein beta-6-like [Oppia nitens]|uniref:heat shock protein beta-6-like n=1 Tax=Oppia nitens TaxID=1686743 RepID=UPI0023DA6408|nr:heat shock protein beta-6-like [Oppia nitens]
MDQLSIYGSPHFSYWPQNMPDTVDRDYHDLWRQSMPKQSGVVTNTGTDDDDDNNNNKFVIQLDVSKYKPDEIEVKTVGSCVQIHCKHNRNNSNSKKSDHRWPDVREFNRRYALPDGYYPENVVSSLLPNGWLIIEANKQLKQPSVLVAERTVPIKYY